MICPSWALVCGKSTTRLAHAEGIGQGIARALKDGLVKREELFVVSKLWNTFHDGDKVEPIARKQLEDLGLEYFDLFLIHFPVALKWVDPAERYPPGWAGEDGKITYSNADSGKKIQCVYFQ